MSKYKMVNFKIMERWEINFDDNADGDGFLSGAAADDGAYLVEQAVVQHNGEIGKGFKIVLPGIPELAYGEKVPEEDLTEYFEDAAKDMVTALPTQITRIMAKFDKPGRYVWHCHILSHEDHEMMRVLQVGPEPGPEPEEPVAAPKKKAKKKR